MADEITAPRADSDLYPWVHDFDGVWHRRPPGQPWRMHRLDGANAETVCGRWVPSVQRSTFAPEEDAQSTVCPDCRPDEETP